MKIVGRKSENTDALKSLWQTCFGDEKSYIDWCFDKRFLEDEVLSLYKGDKLCGMTAQLTYPILLKDKTVSCGFIEGLCTHPDFRYQHVATDLLKHALSLMRKDGRIFCFLVPFKVSYYAHQGFCLYNELKKVSVTMDGVPQKALQDGETVCEIKEPSAALNACYETYMDGGSYVERSERFWQYVMEAGTLSGVRFYGLYRGEKLAGYLYLALEDDAVNVYEIGYVDAAAFLSLMAYVKTYQSRATRINITFSKTDEMTQQFLDDKHAVSLVPYAMGRIVDVKKVLELYQDCLRDNVAVKIQDDLCPENNGVYLKKDGSVILTNKARDTAIDIKALLDILWGNLTQKNAKVLGMMQGADAFYEHEILKKTYANLLFD